MTNGFKLYQDNRPKNAPVLERMPAEDFKASVDVVEGDFATLFENEVPRVRGELVKKPSGLPPTGWDLLPVGSLK